MNDDLMLDNQYFIHSVKYVARHDVCQECNVFNVGVPPCEHFSWLDKIRCRSMFGAHYFPVAEQYSYDSICNFFFS